MFILNAEQNNWELVLHAASVSVTLLSRGEWSWDVPILAFFLLLLFHVFLLFHSVRPRPLSVFHFRTYCWNSESFRQLVVHLAWGVGLPRGLCPTQDSASTETTWKWMRGVGAIRTARSGNIRTIADTTHHRPHVALLRWWNYGVYRELDMWRVRGNRNTRAILVRKLVGKRPLVQKKETFRRYWIFCHRERVWGF